MHHAVYQQFILSNVNIYGNINLSSSVVSVKDVKMLHSNTLRFQHHTHQGCVQKQDILSSKTTQVNNH